MLSTVIIKYKFFFVKIMIKKLFSYMKNITLIISKYV